MSLVVLGLSHRSAPMALLEAAALGTDQVEALTRTLSTCENVQEALVLATCNRLEVYAEASTFHGAVTEIGAALVSACGVGREELTEHLYVHYEDRAIAHLLTVACGLDSMAVGESQILGQLRTALRRAQRDGRVGPALNGVFQHALRVGKRAHAETGLDGVGLSLVEAGLAQAERHVGSLAGASVLVVGAGAMSHLAAATASRLGCARLVLVSRTLARAERLAELTSASAQPLRALPGALAEADIVISCTGAVGHVVTTPRAQAAVEARGGRPQAYLDLALPRDVDPQVSGLPGVLLVGLAELGEALARHRAEHDEPDGLAEVRDLVTAEVAAYLTSRRMQAVGPTVAALRERAREVMQAEIDRLATRMPDLGEHEHAEFRLAMHRLVEKLLHTPTVRVKELAGTGTAGDYAHALRELFGLDPYDVAAVSTPPDPVDLP